MKRSITAAAIAATISLGSFAFGVTGAEAYQQSTNAAVKMRDGATTDYASLANALCKAKGFSGAQAFKFAGFQSNGGSVNAVFKSVKCTMVAAKVVTASAVAIVNGKPTIRPGKEVTSAINNAVMHGAIGNSIGKGIERNRKERVKSSVGKSLSKGFKVH